ncbi:hypothetical protein [Oceanirhabdus seepicola]|uniref:ABC transporter permease n=1 Tax=Oceanirhabdus seepicola TaxID=2828781 RepID=A0A9J6P342_9CLOT|nr:hypothetical protein [Oceanirhabdus seepicola]MCM1990947.1 ABC transporter permease [Oceanirhabdus seepicola]
MSMKKSWLDKGLVLNDLKRYWWAMALYCIAMIFVAVLPISSLTIKESLSLKEINNCLFAGPIYVIIIGGAVGISILVFSFMNRKASSEFIYSLPLTKKTIFISKYIAGLIMILIPLIISYSILIILMGVNGLYTIVNIMYVIKVIFLFILISALAYTISIAIGSFTSSSIATGVFFFVFMYLPSALKRIVEVTLSLWIYGYTGHSLYENDLYFGIMERLNPISSNKVLGLRNLDVEYYLNSGLLINFVLCIVGYLIISYLLFNRRKSEAVGNMIAFKWFSPILKYGFTLCVMFTSLIFLENRYGESGFSYKIGVYLITGAIAYCIVTCFIEKSISVIFKKKQLKGFGIYFLIVFIGFYGIWINLFGVQEFNVNTNEVEFISMFLNVEGQVGDINIQIEDKNLMKEALKFKDYLLENRKKYIKSSGYMPRIHYKIFSDGEFKESRAYYFNEKLLDHESLKNIYLSKENKNHIYGGIESGQDVNYLMLEKGYMNRYGDRDAISKKKILDRDTINQLTKAIKKDVDGFRFEDLMNTDVIGSIILFADIDSKVVDDGEIITEKSENVQRNITITNRFENTINTLKELELYDEILLSTDEVEKIVVYTRDREHREITVTEPSIMEKLIKEGFRNEYNIIYERYGDHQHGFDIYLNNGRVIPHYELTEEGMTDEIKELLMR